MNHWQKEFGAKRREIDRKLLAEIEKQIATEEKIEFVETAKYRAERIARAFGRPS